ncbi:MAG: hypothetical protein PHW66_07560 [Gallionella sp.]|jgi:hypothetical protein|nr:hypothetical protein [Gallionella sp.]
MTAVKKSRGTLISLISVVAILFGLMTIKEGGAVLLGNETAVAAAGNYVSFVLWFNFLSGIIYIAAGIGLWLQQRWAVWLSVALVVAIAITFATFGLHIYSGGAYEPRTVVAMSARLLVWLAIAAISVMSIGRSRLREG